MAKLLGLASYGPACSCPKTLQAFLVRPWPPFSRLCLCQIAVYELRSGQHVSGVIEPTVRRSAPSMALILGLVPCGPASGGPKTLPAFLVRPWPPFLCSSLISIQGFGALCKLCAVRNRTALLIGGSIVRAILGPDPADQLSAFQKRSRYICDQPVKIATDGFCLIEIGRYDR